jgi:hypothetical protein
LTDVAALLQDLEASRPIPAIDLSAATPADLYPLSSIVTDSELGLIDTNYIYGLSDETSRLAAMPFKYAISGIC